MSFNRAVMLFLSVILFIQFQDPWSEFKTKGSFAGANYKSNDDGKKQWKSIRIMWRLCLKIWLIYVIMAS